VLHELGMCSRGGDRNCPGGKRSGPKPKMDEESVAKRMKREASQARTAQRKAADAAAAEQEEKAEQQRALLREKLADQPMCARRMHGSKCVADKAAAVAAAPAASSGAGSCCSALAGHAARLLLEAVRARGVNLGTRRGNSDRVQLDRACVRAVCS
jgi:hypothetical protein